MKYVIASDIHGSAYYCSLLKERYLAEDAQKLVLLGDLLYHGARNPLPRDYSTLKTAEILNSMKEHILCVRGNCDSDVDTLVLEFPIVADYAILPAAGRTLVLTHGHRTYGVLSGSDVLVNGHFHVPAFEQREGHLYVNCGSVSIPKDGSWHGCIRMTEDAIQWLDLDGKVRDELR